MMMMRIWILMELFNKTKGNWEILRMPIRKMLLVVTMALKEMVVNVILEFQELSHQPTRELFLMKLLMSQRTLINSIKHLMFKKMPLVTMIIPAKVEQDMLSD